ncbi:MAG TPA: hypothetical protein VIU11_20675 [Nakamurella sp.]
MTVDRDAVDPQDDGQDVGEQLLRRHGRSAHPGGGLGARRS